MNLKEGIYTKKTVQHKIQPYIDGDEERTKNISDKKGKYIANISIKLQGK